jgi:hypothetical protein
MKKGKLLLTILFTVCVAISLNSCKKCKNEDPQAKIINNGTQKASVQIQTSGGNTVNINNIEPGASSVYTAFAQGIATFTITVSSNNYVQTVDMAQCFYYDIAIDANNIITTTPIDRNN